MTVKKTIFCRYLDCLFSFKLFQHYKLNTFIEDPKFNFEILLSPDAMNGDSSLEKAKEESSISFQDGRSKNGSSESIDSSSSVRTIQLTRRHSPQSAPNIIKGNHCQACDKDVCFEKEVIQCRLCKDYLHAINCEGFTEHWVSSKTSFSSHILPALNNKRNSGTGRKRPGAFWYICDCCETDIEKSDAVNEIDKVVILEQKIDSVQTNLRDEISELKNLIINLNNKSADDFSVNTNAQLEPSLTKNDNVWMDSQRTERLKHLIAVQKTDSGVKVDTQKLEKILINNKISVHKTFELQKSSDTGLVVNSKEEADFLIEKLGNELPEHKTSIVSNRIPTITIVGLERQFSSDELTSMIVNQNPGIAAIRQNASPEDNILDIVKVQPLRNNSTVFKAIVRVSNLIRSVISKQGDRLFMGCKTCKIYDFVFTLRCYNCQQFGHHSSNCENASACAHCAGDHETRSCKNKSATSVGKCKNCSSARKADTAHEASSYECPIFREKRSSIMKTIPFHQRKKQEHSRMERSRR